TSPPKTKNCPGYDWKYWIHVPANPGRMLPTAPMITDSDGSDQANRSFLQSSGRNGSEISHRDAPTVAKYTMRRSQTRFHAISWLEKRIAACAGDSRPYVV